MLEAGSARNCLGRHISAAAEPLLRTKIQMNREHTENSNPILDRRISVRMFVRVCVTLRVPPLDSETGWTGELWSKTLRFDCDIILTLSNMY